ncbi:MAG: hypothetical protein HY097_00665 [Nitrospinae bacterium]|nr:hypothetical protein [Nitrospinota bacterium]
MNKLRLFFVCFFIGISFIAFTYKSSDALPAFARKHEVSCSLCHSTWPRLNDFGFKYLLNGYQMPDTEDGGEAGKIKVAEDLPLDSPSSFPPFTLRLEGIAYLSRTNHTPSTSSGTGENGQAGGLLSSGEMSGNIIGGGTLTKNTSYYLNIPQGSSPDKVTGRITESLFLGFHNIAGRGMVNIKFGSLLNPDLDAVHGTRRIFYGKSPVPLPMIWSAGNGTGRAGSYDLGISLYGRPNFGPITYDFIISQGNGGESDNDNDDNLGYAGMVRGDFGPIAASARYFVNSQGFGGTAGSRKYRNEVNEWTAGIRYSSHRFDIDFLYDTAAQSDVSSTGSGTRRESSGFMLEGLLRISSSFEVGAVYETLAEKDGGADSNKDAGFSIEGAWYITQNARFTFKTLWDMQDDKYKSKYTTSGGEQKGINGSKITIGFDVAL